MLTPYKLYDAELETIVDYWPMAWRETVSLDEVSMGPPVNALVDPVPKPDQQSHHDSDKESSWTPTDSEAE